MCYERPETADETVRERAAILNVAAGRFMPLELNQFDPRHIINVDLMYSMGIERMSEIENKYMSWTNTEGRSDIVYCKIDIWEFLESFSQRFDHIAIYRFMEHIERPKLDYFIYLLSGVLRIGQYVDCIVPNYNTLASMVLGEKVGSEGWDAHDIVVTTELLNEPPDSHASVWTPERAKYYFEKEKRFKVESVTPRFKFDGRDIYMRFFARRVEI